MLSAAVTAWAGCRNTPTEIVAGVTTQLQVPKFLQSVGVLVQRGGQPIICRSYPVVDGEVTLPATIGTIPEDNEATGPVTVQILGFRLHDQNFESNCLISAAAPDVGDGEIFIVRRARMPYVDERILYMPLPLRESCSEIDCADDETCVGSLCEPIDVDVSTLVDYDDSLIFGTANTCFSPNFCLPDAAVVPALLEDESDCTFSVPWPEDAPTPEPGALNVRIVYDNFSVEVLDLDDKEGFVLPDTNDPLTFKLASNMCQGAFANGRIIGIQAAPICPSKTPLQPICADELVEIIAGDTNLAGGSVDLCTQQGSALSQTESALYVLMDSSAAMAEFFGPEGLAFAVNTPLENPIAARTRVAFAKIPASSCMASAQYENSPDIPFGLVTEVREPIGLFLNDTNNLLPNDPDVNLEAAMTGAYAALSALTPTSSQQFNRRALIIVGNRNLEGSCGVPGGAPPDLATAAFGQTDRIHTYVAALDAPNGTPLVGDPVSAGSQIASAGGTSLFDAINDEAEGAKAVQEVINDLGTCLYDRPVAGVFENDTIPDAAALSYMNPVNLERTDIPKNDACAAGTSDSGWNQDANGQVRICGAACDGLRDMLNDVSLTYAVLGKPAPRVPVQVTVPCRQ